MYSWGGSTSDWKGSGRYNYNKSRSPYLKKLEKEAKAKGPRTYTSSRAADMGLVNTRGKTISSNSEHPIILAVDVTGSMSSWPAEIFDRLPLFYQTVSQYKQDAEVCFAAIGDAFCDTYPIQVNDFAKALDLEEKLKAIGCEGGGGGGISESYELFAYFMDKHCATPKATSPFLFVFGDESYYEKIEAAQVRHYIGDNISTDIDSKQVWQELSQKFNLYFLHKPYGHDGNRDIDKLVVARWKDAVGEQKVIELPNKERAVDVAMAIVARSWGQFEDFKGNLKARQSSKDIRESVYDAIKSVHG